MHTCLETVCRLALRKEGPYWVAYCANENTMEGAIKLGMVLMSFVDRDPARKAHFRDMMKEACADVIEDNLGVRPIWPTPPKPALDHERPGDA